MNQKQDVRNQSEEEKCDCPICTNDDYRLSRYCLNKTQTESDRHVIAIEGGLVQ
ncbi:MAG: hypothetical protein KJI69_03520 [Patescibacteria group bacterium]|nr:hypothetical protein [Patescibacteria group bacterium]